MKKIPFILSLIICLLIWSAVAFLVITSSGCASTSFYRDGKVIARFQGDMANVAYQDGKISFTATTVNHSKATIAGGNAASKGILSTGTAVATSGILPVIK